MSISGKLLAIILVPIMVAVSTSILWFAATLDINNPVAIQPTATGSNPADPQICEPLLRLSNPYSDEYLPVSSHTPLFW